MSGHDCKEMSDAQTKARSQSRAVAQLGAVQIWENYRHDPQDTIDRFRHAISLGHTVTVPEFYALAGARFALDTEALKQAMGVIQRALMKQIKK